MLVYYKQNTCSVKSLIAMRHLILYHLTKHTQLWCCFSVEICSIRRFLTNSVPWQKTQVVKHSLINIFFASLTLSFYQQIIYTYKQTARRKRVFFTCNLQCCDLGSFTHLLEMVWTLLVPDLPAKTGCKISKVEIRNVLKFCIPVFIS